MKGEFDSAQRETSEAYRENWERVFGNRQQRKRAIERADWNICGVPVYIDHDAQSGSFSYINGCPILDEDQRANQANGPAA